MFYMPATCSEGRIRTSVPGLAGTDMSPTGSGMRGIVLVNELPDELTSFSRFELFFSDASLLFGRERFGQQDDPGSKPFSPSLMSEHIMRQQALLKVGGIPDVDFVVERRIEDIDGEHGKK